MQFRLDSGQLPGTVLLPFPNLVRKDKLNAPVVANGKGPTGSQTTRDSNTRFRYQ